MISKHSNFIQTEFLIFFKSVLTYCLMSQLCFLTIFYFLILVLTCRDCIAKCKVRHSSVEVERKVNRFEDPTQGGQAHAALNDYPEKANKPNVHYKIWSQLLFQLTFESCYVKSFLLNPAVGPRSNLMVNLIQTNFNLHVIKSLEK